ncbi:hypothetical protein NQ905_12885 [Clostridioides difficile]|nr:hypothetical protein [Clostridioides difficile]MCR1465380.1 hypothetical protein [Clostridioides difficile]MDW0092496.1 hypothetical protein [Clostridioides difficile]HBF4082061.1 hypothetical protein [Clostridioides difficile]HBF4083259.1 hypothetical protein [Clostridioides difficile]
MNTCRMNIYNNYKNENVAIYAKKSSEKENVNEHIIGKVTWMKMEIEEFGVNILEFVDSHTKGEYQEINKLIELVKKDEIRAILIWDFADIPTEIVEILVDECSKRDVYLNGFLTTINTKEII